MKRDRGDDDDNDGNGLINVKTIWLSLMTALMLTMVFEGGTELPAFMPDI